jgi:hypothetical protein
MRAAAIRLADYGSCLRRSVDYLYSLYDALVSINVPSDKARAVVDAMERDMGTTLATKKDLEAQSLATKKDLELLRLATKQDIDILRMETKQDIEVLKVELKQDIQLLRKEMDSRFALVDERFRTLESRMTVKLGSMFAATIFLLAAMRFWS